MVSKSDGTTSLPIFKLSYPSEFMTLMGHITVGASFDTWLLI